MDEGVPSPIKGLACQIEFARVARCTSVMAGSICGAACTVARTQEPIGRIHLPSRHEASVPALIAFTRSVRARAAGFLGFRTLPDRGLLLCELSITPLGGGTTTKGIVFFAKIQ